MTRHVFIFIACFLVAAVVTTVIRTSRHMPYVGPAEAQMPDQTMSPPMGKAAPDMTAMAMPMSTSTPPVVANPSMSPAPSSTAAVNTICAICGMPVNPALPTAMYQGKVIGFGCKTCPPRFAKEPDKFGPAALANRVVEDQ